MSKETLGQQSDEELYQLPKEKLVLMIQALKAELARLKEIVNKDSKTSSKPPSQDIIKKSEKKKSELDGSSDEEKRKPGGQPGHIGKTRKGFGRVDRFEILRPQFCNCCGLASFTPEPIKVETQQVAQLVEHPIEIVEYHRYTCVCEQCGNSQAADWSEELVPGQDLGIRLQGFLGWVNNYGHLSYEKQQELLWELGKIEIGVGLLVATKQEKAHQWWYFLDHPEIPPDNNLAERTLRLAVTKRKVSGGSRSMERFQDTAHLLTVVQTCRRQERSVIEFFEQALQAMVNPSVQTPSLIPQL
jgi:transposase